MTDPNEQQRENVVASTSEDLLPLGGEIYARYAGLSGAASMGDAIVLRNGSFPRPPAPFALNRWNAARSGWKGWPNLEWLRGRHKVTNHGAGANRSVSPKTLARKMSEPVVVVPEAHHEVPQNHYPSGTDLTRHSNSSIPSITEQTAPTSVAASGLVPHHHLRDTQSFGATAELMTVPSGAPPLIQGGSVPAQKKDEPVHIGSPIYQRSSGRHALASGSRPIGRDEPLSAQGIDHSKNSSGEMVRDGGPASAGQLRPGIQIQRAPANSVVPDPQSIPAPAAPQPSAQIGSNSFAPPHGAKAGEGSHHIPAPEIFGANTPGSRLHVTMAHVHGEALNNTSAMISVRSPIATHHPEQRAIHALPSTLSSVSGPIDRVRQGHVDARKPANHSTRGTPIAPDSSRTISHAVALSTAGGEIHHLAGPATNLSAGNQNPVSQVNPPGNDAKASKIGGVPPTMPRPTPLAPGASTYAFASSLASFGLGAPIMRSLGEDVFQRHRDALITHTGTGTRSAFAPLDRPIVDALPPNAPQLPNENDQHSLLKATSTRPDTPDGKTAQPPAGELLVAPGMQLLRDTAADPVLRTPSTTPETPQGMTHEVPPTQHPVPNSIPGASRYRPMDMEHPHLTSPAFSHAARLPATGAGSEFPGFASSNRGVVPVHSNSLLNGVAESGGVARGGCHSVSDAQSVGDTPAGITLSSAARVAADPLLPNPPFELPVVRREAFRYSPAGASQIRGGLLLRAASSVEDDQEARFFRSATSQPSASRVTRYPQSPLEGTLAHAGAEPAANSVKQELEAAAFHPDSGPYSIPSTNAEGRGKSEPPITFVSDTARAAHSFDGVANSGSVEYIHLAENKREHPRESVSISGLPPGVEVTRLHRSHGTSPPNGRTIRERNLPHYSQGMPRHSSPDRTTDMHASPGTITHLFSPASMAPVVPAFESSERISDTSHSNIVLRSPFGVQTGTMPTPPSPSASSAPPFTGSTIPPARNIDIRQLANQVYELLVRRLSSERQRRGY